jgi:hypothetical protein
MHLDQAYLVWRDVAYICLFNKLKKKQTNITLSEQFRNPIETRRMRQNLYHYHRKILTSLAWYRYFNKNKVVVLS